jgi:hypothetical protein
LSLKQTRDKLGGMKAAGRNLNTAAITNIQWLEDPQDKLKCN